MGGGRLHFFSKQSQINITRSDHCIGGIYYSNAFLAVSVPLSFRLVSFIKNRHF